MTSLVLFHFALFSTGIMATFKDQTESAGPPTELKRKWLDPITVELSWMKPGGLSHNGDVNYEFTVDKEVGKLRSQENTGIYITNLFTREMDSKNWTFQVWISNANQSLIKPATLNFSPMKQKAELVKNFKCFLNDRKLNCSWIPVDPSLNLTVRYRQCGTTDEQIKSVKTCEKPLSTGNQSHQCIMTCNKSEDRTCIFVETDNAVSSFKAPLAIDPPLLNVTVFDDDMLILTLTPPLQKLDCMTFEVCHSRCNVHKECRNTSQGFDTMNFTYDKACRYEFQAKTNFLKHCLNPALVSEMSATISYGVNADPYRILTIAAVFMSFILSVCIILLCYCFRKHREIFWPSIPDPSVIFKPMMNGNNDPLTPGGNLYTPVPEPIDACKIRLISENCINQYTS
ncbi:hypothetical protein D4764_03G0006220 [Takifugu flavidus]|uniref:Fibronectin type-III domain-containing protein n=1 Tax=Takifugu flavidus TaxID=433684 RepID=A0A5C6N7Z9_9TELE|nr:hypothetical protein D4764_03G0006220 [Takifugu flavidus]